MTGDEIEQALSEGAISREQAIIETDKAISEIEIKLENAQGGSLYAPIDIIEFYREWYDSKSRAKLEFLKTEKYRWIKKNLKRQKIEILSIFQLYWLKGLFALGEEKIKLDGEQLLARTRWNDQKYENDVFNSESARGQVMTDAAIRQALYRGEMTSEKAMAEIKATLLEIEEAVGKYAHKLATSDKHFNDAHLFTEDELFHLSGCWKESWGGLYRTFKAGEERAKFEAFEKCAQFTEFNYSNGYSIKKLLALRTEIETHEQQPLSTTNPGGGDNDKSFINLRKKIIRGEIGEEEATREAQAMLEEINWNILKKYPGEAAGMIQLYDEYTQKVREYRESSDAGKYKECMEAANRYSSLLHRVGYDPVETLALQQMVVNPKTTSTAETKSTEEKIQEDNEMPYFGEYEDCLKRYKNGYMITGEISTYIEQVVNDFPAIEYAMLKGKLYDRDGIPLKPTSLSTLISRFKRKKGRE